MTLLIVSLTLAGVLSLAAQELNIASTATNAPAIPVEPPTSAQGTVATDGPVQVPSNNIPGAVADASATAAPSSVDAFPRDDSSVTNQPHATGYDLPAFRIIVERNIFNPNRSPRRDYSRRDRDRERESRPARTESFGLLGIMAYEKGRFAFFDGSSSDYRKVLEPTQTIAGYTVMAVLPNAVTLLATNGDHVQLAVGMQMRRREDEPWRLGERGPIERAESSSSTSSNSAPTGTASGTEVSSNSTAGAATSGSDAEDEVLKRMLQKREEELNK